MSVLRPVIGFALTVGLFYASYSFVYKPVQQYQKGLHVQISALEKDTIVLNQRLTALYKSKTVVTFPEALLWRATTKADAELALQDRVVDLAEQQQLLLISFGSSTVSGDSSQEQIAFEFEGEAQLGNLYMFLSELEQLVPKVAIATLRLRPIQRQEEISKDASVYLQMTLWAFWESST